MEKPVGIDLGTTRSLIGISEERKCTIISDRFGNQSIPSVVLVTPSGGIFAGTEATKHPDRYKGKNITIGSIKRIIGKQGETGWGWWKTYPQEISAFILAELKNNAENYIGKAINKAVIAIPSHFDENQRRATKEAAEIAGFDVLRMLNEATSAALAYGIDKKENATVLVFDLGGGTCDISVLEIGEGVFEVKATIGDSQLGGDDFDQVIADYALEHLEKKYGNIELDHIHNLILKESVEKAKRELSTSLEAQIYIPGFIKSAGRFNDIRIPIDRQTFEKLSKELFDRIAIMIMQAFQDSKITAKDLDALLLLGGSSRIPYIRNLIESKFHIRPFAGVNPDTCVVQGAMLLGSVLSGEIRDILLLDVIPSTYGLGLKDGTMSPIIERNTTIPTKKSQVFSTTENGQTSISLSVYQGERKYLKDNTYLMSFNLSNVPPADKGVPQIEVTFDVDPNSILHIKAKDLGTGLERLVELHAPYGLSKKQISIMKKKLDEQMTKRKIAARISDAHRIINDTLSKKLPCLSHSERNDLSKILTRLDEIQKRRTFDDEMENLLSLSQPILDKAKAKISDYEAAVKEMEVLINKLENFIPELQQSKQKDARILEQGKTLLEDYIARKLPYEDLLTMLSSVRSSYISSKAELIFHSLKSFEMTHECRSFQQMINDGVNLSQNSLFEAIKNNKEVISMLRNLETEDNEYCKAMHNHIFASKKIGKELKIWYYAIAACHTDLLLPPMPDFAKHDNEFLDFVTPAIIERLDVSVPLGQRRNAAKFIAMFSCQAKYILPLLKFLLLESDSIVGNSIKDYLHGCSTHELYNCLSECPEFPPSQFLASEKFIIKFAESSEEEHQLFALELLTELPFDQIESIIPVLFTAGKDNQLLDKLAHTLSCINSPQVIPYLMNMVLIGEDIASGCAIKVLNQMAGSMKRDTLKMHKLIRQAKQNKALGMKANIFLRKLKKSNPDMELVIQNLQHFIKQENLNGQ